LLKHEKDFGGAGHTISQHVDVDLVARLAETNRRGQVFRREVSKFTDKATAEKAIKETVMYNKDKIRAWRQNTSMATPQEFDFAGDASTVVGHSILQGQSSTNPRYGTRVVLVKKDPSNPRSGWSILTSYPIP
jgi:hypothetical protein